MQKISNIIIILFIASASYAQVYQAYIDAADKAYESKDFRTALSYYGEAIDLDDEVDLDVLNRYATSAMSYQSYNNAKEAYTKILESDDKAYRKEALYNLAELHKAQGQYEIAKSYLEKFIEVGSEEENVLAQKSLADVEWAIDNNTESIYSLEKLNDEINTEFSEMSPIAYNETLYYSSNNYFASNESTQARSKIYSNLEGKSSRLASLLENKDENIGHYALNTDKSTAYFTKCQYILGEVKCKIFKQDIETEIVTELPQNINSLNAHTTQPNIGVDAKTGKEVLYFVSDRANGVGGLDIYYSPIENGVFEGPYSLKELNTAGDDVSPFYHSSTDKLYFSTNGRRTFGGFDVYSSLLNNEWLEPVNLGSGINSSYDDVYFSLNPDGEVGYLSSNRIGSKYIDEDLEACCYDIYKAILSVITKPIIAKVFDKSTNEPLLGAKLNLSALPELKSEVIYDESASEYQLDIRSDLKYDLQVEKLGYELTDVVIGEDIDEELKVYLEPERIELNAFVIDEEAKKLNDFSYSIKSNKNEEVKEKSVGNDKKIKELLNKNHDHTITVKKEGYYPETIVLSHEELLKEDELALDITLRKISAAVLAKLTLDGYLPLPLFFDNDEPDQNTISTTTKKNYHQTYMTYIQRKMEYVSKNIEGLNTEEKLDAEFGVLNFFDNKVTSGDQALDAFTEHLLSFLQQGSEAEIMLRGYASPRSQSKYNDALTARRVSSVENHFYQWRSGVLVNYINSGQLKITERPLGESQAPVGVSDEISDRKGSIYSVEASAERRVEILEIKSNVNTN